MANLPSDIIIEILVRLTVVSLLRFKCVCKEWYKLINSSKFIQLHLKKSLNNDNISFAYACGNSLYIVEDAQVPSNPTKLCLSSLTYEHLYLVGSCNGLVCLTTCPHYRRFILCNPSTRTFKNIFTHLWKDDLYHKDRLILSGFGYDSMNDDYKVVMVYIDPFFKNGPVEKMIIYGLNNKSWTKLSHSTPKKYVVATSSSLDYGVLANNMLHWIFKVDGGLRIACLDISLEKWGDELDLPDICLFPLEQWGKNLNYLDFGLLDGCLCLQVRTPNENCDEFSADIWIMKEYGVGDSWTRLFHVCVDQNIFQISTMPFFAPIANTTTRNELKVLFCNRNALWYDQQEGTTEEFKLNLSNRNYSSRNGGIMVCASSLVLIPGSSQMERQGNIQQPISELKEEYARQTSYIMPK